VVEDSSSLAGLSSFSSNGNWFAFVSLAIDKHRLRVYDTVTGQSVAEHVVDLGRVTVLTWRTFNLSGGHHPFVEDDSAPSKKKRRRSDTQTPSVIEVVVLGLSSGSLSFFSPTHGRVLRTLSHSTNTTAVLSVAFTDGEDISTIWTTGADGVIRLWNTQTNELLSSWKTDDRIPYSSMATRPGFHAKEECRVDILVANHGIRLLSMMSSPSDINSETRKPKELASFTGHASSIVHLHWDSVHKSPNRFFSAAEGDRIVYIWEVPDIQGLSIPGKMVASIPLDSDVRSIALSVSSLSASTIGGQNLLTLSASGKISVYPIPSELTSPASSKKIEHKVPTLLPRSNISVSSKKKGLAVQVVGASFTSGMDGHIRIARVVGGVRPTFKLIVRVLIAL
jgi:U3 small nucleolar RNA-associated protein 5